MTIAENEKKSIVNTALLIKDDESVINRLIDIKKSGKKADNKENIDFLQRVVASKLNCCDNIPAEFNTLLRKTLVKCLLENQNHKKNIEEKNLDPLNDYLLPYFIDITNINSVYHSIRTKPERIHEIIFQESLFLQAFGQNTKEQFNNNVKEIRNKTNGISFEEIILKLTNSLYKKILFGDLETEIFRKKGKFFRYAGGSFNTIKEMYERIDELPDEKFKEHIQNADFYNWLAGNAFDDDQRIKSIAENIKNASSKKDLCDRINESSKNLQKEKLEEDYELADPDHIIAAGIFLKSLQPELIDLVPRICSKESLKCLKLVDRYIRENKEDAFRKEIVAFLSDPFDFIKKMPMAVDRNFDFKSYFEERITSNIRYSEIDSTVNSALEKYSSQQIETKEQYEECKAWQEEISGFINAFKNSNLPQMEPVLQSSDVLNERIEYFDDLVEKESMKFENASINIQELLEKLDKFLGAEPTEPNIRNFKKSRRELAQIDRMQQILDKDLVLEYEIFDGLKERLMEAVETRKNQINTFFNTRQRRISIVLASKTWDKQQDVKELKDLVANDELKKIFRRARLFYGKKPDKLPGMLDIINEKINKYEKMRDSLIAEISESHADMERIAASLENIIKEPDRLKISHDKVKYKRCLREYSSIKKTKEAILDIDFSSYHEDEGLLSSLVALETAKSMAEAGLVKVKSKAKQNIDEEIEKIKQDVKEPYQYSKEILLLNNLASQARNTAKIAQSIDYDIDENIELILQDITGLKEDISEEFERKTRVISEIEDAIEEDYLAIKESYKQLRRKDILADILDTADNWQKNLDVCRDYCEDENITPVFKKVQERINSAYKEIDRKTEFNINRTLKKARETAEQLKVAEIATITDIYKKLRQRKRHIRNLGQQRYADKIREPKKEIEELVQQAKLIRDSIRKDQEAEIAKIKEALDQPYEWSRDKDFVLEKMESIKKLEKDAVSLEFNEQNTLIAEVRSLANKKIREIAKEIQKKADNIISTTEENKTAYASFTGKKDEIPDEEIILKTNKILSVLESKISQYDEWPDDPAFENLLNEAKSDVKDFKEDAYDHIFTRLNSIDAVISDCNILSSKTDPDLEELNDLKDSIDLLEEQRQKYMQFHKENFQDIVRKKISLLDEAKINVTNRIDDLINALGENLLSIDEELAQVSNYSQEIPKLEKKALRIEEIEKKSSVLQNALLLERVAECKSNISSTLESIQSEFNEREIFLSDLSEELDKTAYNVEAVINGKLSDSELLGFNSEIVRLKTEFDEKIDWFEDHALETYFENADSLIEKSAESIKAQGLAKISLLYSVVEKTMPLANKSELNPEEIKNLKTSIPELQNCAEQYSFYCIDDLKDIVQEKTKNTAEAKIKAENLIETIKQQKIAELSAIADFLQKEHMYFQNIKTDLMPNLEKLDKIEQYCKALDDSDLLDTVEDLKSDIEKNIADINTRVDERLNQLKEKERKIAALSDAADDLFSGGIFADKIKQCYADVDSMISDIDSIDVDWKKDSKVLPECLSLEPKVNALKSRLDKIIDEKTVLIDEHVDKYKKFIEDIVLDSPSAVAELLAAETQMDYALEDYSNLLVLRPEEYKKKEDHIQDIIEVFSDKISAKKKELDEKLALLERHKDSEYEFSQHQKKIEDNLEKNLVLEDYFCILQDNKNIERLLDLEEKLISKIFDLQILYDERYEKAAPLKDKAEKIEEEFEQVVKNISEKDSLKKAIELLKSLKKSIDEHAEIAADKLLYKDIFAGAKEIFERLKTNLEGRGNEAIAKLSESIDLANVMFPTYMMQGIDSVKRFMENKSEIDLIREKLDIFQEAKDVNFDLQYAYDKLKPVQEMIDEKIQEAKEDVDFVVDTRIDSLRRIEFKYLHQLNTLKEYKSALEEKRDICILIDEDKKQVDSCIAQVDRRIEWLDIPYKDLVETLMDTEEHLQFATKKINKLFEADMNSQSFGFVLALLDDARSSVDKAYTNKYIREKEFENQVIAIDLLMGGLQSLVDERIEIELAKITNPAKDLISQIKKPETIQELDSLREKRYELEQIPEKLEAFSKDKYCESAGEKRQLVIEGIEFAKQMEEEYDAEFNSRISQSDDMIRELNRLLSNVQEKESGPDYLSALTILGKGIKQADKITASWKKDDAIVTYFAKNLAGPMQEIEAETRRRQEELCALLEAAITGYEENLARPWHSHEDIKKLNKWFSDFKTKSRPYLSFRNSILDNELFEKITRRYIFAFQRVKKIKSEFRALVNAEKRDIDNLKRQATGFDDIRVQLSDLIDELPENHLDTVKQMDSYLKNLQKSVAQLNGRLVRTAEMENDVVALKTKTEKNTQYFAESIYNLEQALVQRRNLQRQGLQHNRGVTKFLMRKAKSLLSSSYKKDIAVLNDLDEIKKYHESLVENNN